MKKGRSPCPFSKNALFCGVDEAAVVPQVLDAGNGRHGSHQPAQHHGNAGYQDLPHALLCAGSRHACNGHAKEVEDDAQHLQHGLHLAPHVGGDHLAVLGTGGHHAQAGHSKLAGQNDAQHHGAAALPELHTPSRIM